MTRLGARVVRAMVDLSVDLRHGCRLAARNPGITGIAVLTIALGVGASTAIFSLVDAVLLKRLPVRAPEQLLFLDVASANGGTQGAPPYPLYEQFRDGSRAFSGMAAFTFESMILTIDGRPERALGQLASASWFDLLGVGPAIGRTFVPGDERLEPAVAVLSHRYWQRRFGGAPDVLGRTFAYKDRLLTIVGVSERGFMGMEPGVSFDVAVPITLAGTASLGERGMWWLDAVGRLAPGVSREQALGEVEPLFQAFMGESGQSPIARQNFARMALTPAAHGLGSLRGTFRQPLGLLMGLVAVVLLIACANVANLLLARAAARRRELATRVALGASSGRLLRQLLAESLLLALAGTVLGVTLAGWLAAGLTGFFEIAREAVVLDLPFDRRLFGVAVGLCLSTTLLFGLAPALRAARVDAFTDLKRAGGPNAAAARRLGVPVGVGLPIGAGLVVAQITLSLVLLVATSLLIATVTSLRSLDAGFRAAGVTTMDVELSREGQSIEALSPRWEALVARVTGLPGVQSASLSWLTPLDMRSRGRQIRVSGLELSPRERGPMLNHVSPSYFATMGIPLRLGRGFTPRDAARVPRVALLSETAARFYFKDRNPLGQRIEFTGVPEDAAAYEIVGVVADAKHAGLREPPPRLLYLPVSQAVDHLGRLTLAVRTHGDAAGPIARVRGDVLATGPDVVIGHVTTMTAQIDRSLRRERLLSTLSGGFGLLGLLLAAVGLFGVMSYSVQQRRRDIAVRIALGASAPAIRTRVLTGAITLAAIGIACGVPLSLLAARALTSLLFGIEPANPLILASCSAMLLLVAALAAWLPAHRASRVDPMTVLRAE